MSRSLILALMRPWLPLPLLLPLLVLFVGAPLVIYRRSEKELSPKLLAGLVGLRVASVLILFLIVLRPISVQPRRIEEKSHLPILIDNSRSMGQQDMPGGLSRIDAVKQFWRRHPGLFSELKKQFEVSVYPFDGELAEKSGKRFLADGDATGVGPAMLKFWRERRRGRLAGLVLFSDGNHNSGLAPQGAAMEFARGRVPIYPVLVGAAQPTRSMRDVKLADLVAPGTVDLGNSFEVTIGLGALACAGEVVELTCEFAGKRVGREEVTIVSDSASQRIRFDVPTTFKGTFPLVIKARPLEGEQNLDNNKIEVPVRVRSRKLLVLLLEGVLRWETRFLRRALSEDPGVNLVVGYVVDPAMRTRLLDARYREQFDVLLIGDVAASQLPEEFLRSVPALVALREADKGRGRGLMMMGGWRAYSGGHWSGTRLAKILPVELGGEPSRFEGEVRARPTNLGRKHFALRFSERADANELIWQRMPPLLDSELFVRTKTVGQVLLDGPKGPVLVVSPYGLGRVATLASASTWRWVMNEGGEFKKYHRQFWRQLVLWLAKRDEEIRGRMWLTIAPSKNQVSQNERLKLVVHAVDAQGRPDLGVKCSLTILREGDSPETRTPVFDPLLRAYVLPYRPSRPGRYRVSGVVQRGGKELGRDELSFTVRRPADIELSNPLARADILLEVASRTRGRMVQLPGAVGLLRSLLARKRTIVYTFEVQKDRWNNGFWLVLFALLLGAEWWLRKLRGFV